MLRINTWILVSTWNKIIILHSYICKYVLRQQRLKGCACISNSVICVRTFVWLSVLNILCSTPCQFSFLILLENMVFVHYLPATKKKSTSSVVLVLIFWFFRHKIFCLWTECFVILDIWGRNGTFSFLKDTVKTVTFISSNNNKFFLCSKVWMVVLY